MSEGAVTPGAESQDEDGKEGLRSIQAQSLRLAELLANVFDAADESDEGLLTHKEVADLLYATIKELELPPWDIQVLLGAAHENSDGLIEYKPFVQIAPDTVEALRSRRRAFAERPKCGEVTL